MLAIQMKMYKPNDTCILPNSTTYEKTSDYVAKKNLLSCKCQSPIEGFIAAGHLHLHQTRADKMMTKTHTYGNCHLKRKTLLADTVEMSVFIPFLENDMDCV